MSYSKESERSEVAPVRPGEELDWDRLAPYLRTVLRVSDESFGVEQFPNGSPTYLSTPPW